MTSDERDAVLELAWLMANANGRANDDEMAFFDALVEHLTGDASGAAASRIVARVSAASSPNRAARDACERLTTSAAREVAYKAAYAVGVGDLEANDAEARLGELLVQELGVEERAAELEREVAAALASG